MIRTIGAVFVIVAALTLVGAAGASGPVVTYTVSAGTVGNNGWYRSAVTVRLGFSSDITSTTCPGVYTFQSNGEVLTCSATDGTATVQFQLQFKIDAAPPTVTGATPDRSPDGGGWYSHPVAVRFTGNDTTSGIASCTSATYSGPDSSSATVSGTCQDNAGNVSSTASFGLRYDTTAPVVSAALSRAPDANDWYSHPVDINFSATDSGSGVSSCTPPVTYSTPDSPQVAITGGCADAAGNRSSTTATFKYDSTPPAFSKVAVSVSSLTDTLTWKLPGDAAGVTVTRSPGRRAQRSSVVYTGNASTFRDRSLDPGVTYHYAVTVSDPAGNATTVQAKAAVPMLYLPAAGARVAPGAVLRWAASRGAPYYNVQIFRGSHKVLSTWPKRARLRLTRSWKYAGKPQRLAPGRYRWYVWPGKGALKAARYGPLLGGNTFVVRG